MNDGYYSILKRKFKVIFTYKSSDGTLLQFKKKKIKYLAKDNLF